ncbi:MAG: class I SAM-dependent methyltransferase [Chloroflexi bacterium]|nr:class I SAM-dependent methyltransferase [Chloroflexota bacterium]
MPTQEQIYQTEAEQYEALVSREDHEGNIQRALDEIINVDGLDVLDLGAGTGRLAGLLAPRVKSMRAFDLSAHMLKVTQEKLKQKSLTAVADHRSLPLPSQCADLMVSGWSVSYLAVWNPLTWRVELEKWLGEAKRVLRPNSFIVLFESLGTGNESPVKLEHLKDFYPWLDEVGFQNNWIRTDYRFDSVQQSLEIAGFFFGTDMAKKIRQNSWTILPECTGVWWMKI